MSTDERTRQRRVHHKHAKVEAERRPSRQGAAEGFHAEGMADQKLEQPRGAAS